MHPFKLLHVNCQRVHSNVTRQYCRSMPSAGLRHKLSKLQLRAPGHLKGPPCIQRAPKKKKRNNETKEKKRKKGKAQKWEPKIAPTTPPRIYELHRLPPLEIGPENRSNYPPLDPRIFSFCPFLLFSSLGPHTGLIRPCPCQYNYLWL